MDNRVNCGKANVDSRPTTMPIRNQAEGSALVPRKAQRLDGEERKTNTPSTSARPLDSEGEEIVRYSAKAEGAHKQRAMELDSKITYSVRIT